MTFGLDWRCAATRTGEHDCRCLITPNRHSGAHQCPYCGPWTDPGADTQAAESELVRLRAEHTTLTEVFKAAQGWYACHCGAGFLFNVGDTIEDYAALNRWLGAHHDGGTPQCTHTRSVGAPA